MPKKKSSLLSDIDLRIFLSGDIGAMEIGSLVIELEKILKKEVDLVILNNLYKKILYYVLKLLNLGKLFIVEIRKF
jgi:predicted nucleotidyltransferase